MNYAARFQMLDIEAERWWSEDDFFSCSCSFGVPKFNSWDIIGKGPKTQGTKTPLANLTRLCLMHLTLIGLDPPRNLVSLISLDLMSHFRCKRGMELSPRLQASV